jgi:glucose/arabinose dehydrogenase
MIKKIILFLLLSVGVASAAELPAGFVEKLIAQNLDPTDMVIAPDGRIFITIKSGKIAIIENGLLSADFLLNLAVDSFNERGLGHIVLDPNFNSNNYYYVYYTVPNSSFNRVSRFTANGNSTLPGSEVILLDLDGLAGSIHNGGDMIFGTDGKLYISAGESGYPDHAQNKSILLGKILRINSDGSIPADNPFYASLTGKYRAVWALGLRNPYSMDIQPATGKIFVSDVGQADWEEINELQAGKNYGWPLVEGLITTQTPPADYKDPLFAYPHGDGIDKGCAIVGASFYNPTTIEFPSEYVGKFFFADYCNGYIKHLDPTTGTIATFATGINRPLAIVTAPDGSMYYLARAGLGGGSQQDNTSTSDGTLWKVNFTGTGVPSISAQPKSAIAAVGDVVNFVIAASGAQPLSYQWKVDGALIQNATSTSYLFTVTQLADNGKNFSCVVTNSFGSATTDNALLTVTENTNPIPQINSITFPNAATLYQAGQTFQFSGSAMDAEDGVLPASSLTWKIDFHHDVHTHPGLAPTSGISEGSFFIPKVGETDDNVWYRIILSAVDSKGLSKSIFQDIFPQKVDLRLTTTPPNLSLLVDGQPTQTPITIKSVVGITRTLEAPLSQLLGGALQSFSSWSESSLTRVFSFDTPASNKDFSANYATVPVGNGNGLLGAYTNTLNEINTLQNSFSNPTSLLRVDSKIDFNWSGGSPDVTINPDYFTVRWTGEILPQFTEAYTFYLKTDDGARLWIDDKLLIDKWAPQQATEWSGSINLTADQRYKIKVEYFELIGDATVVLQWSSTKTPKQVVPTSQLFSSPITGIEEIGSAFDIQLYPQPADKSVTVEVSSKLAYDYEIYDTVGRTIQKGLLNPEKNEINIETLPCGVYIIRSQSINRKFIKK